MMNNDKSAPADGWAASKMRQIAASRQLVAVMGAINTAAYSGKYCIYTDLELDDQTLDWLKVHGYTALPNSQGGHTIRW